MKQYSTAKELKRQNDMRRIFVNEIDEDEQLLKDYSCTYHKDIVIRGRLYVTPRLLCFHSSILGIGNQLTISFDSITSILKRRIVLLLPNALTICANGRKFVFSSFKNRNQAFNHLFKVWQNVLMGNPLSPEALHAHIHENTPVMTTIGSTSSSVSPDTVPLKQNDESSSPEHVNANAVRTSGYNSEGYCTEERATTSIEDVSTLLPSLNVSYSSSSSSSLQVDNDSYDSGSTSLLSKSIKCVTEGPDTIRKEVKVPAVTTVKPIRQDNTTENVGTYLPGLPTNLMNYLWKHWSPLNMLNLLMILMICLIIFTSCLLFCELSAVDPKFNEMLSWLPVTTWCRSRQQHPDSVHLQLEMVQQMSMDLKALLLQYFNDNIDKLT